MLIKAFYELRTWFQPAINMLGIISCSAVLQAMCGEKEGMCPLLGVFSFAEKVWEICKKSASSTSNRVLQLRQHVKELQTPCLQVPLEWHQNSFALSTTWCWGLGNAAPGTAGEALLSLLWNNVPSAGTWTGETSNQGRNAQVQARISVYKLKWV